MALIVHGVCRANQHHLPVVLGEAFDQHFGDQALQAVLVNQGCAVMGAPDGMAKTATANPFHVANQNHAIHVGCRSQRTDQAVKRLERCVEPFKPPCIAVLEVMNHRTGFVESVHHLNAGGGSDERRHMFTDVVQQHGGWWLTLPVHTPPSGFPLDCQS